MPTQQYNQDHLWKVFETLPEELKQAVFSAENADHTFSICERYGIEECSEVASLIGLVLMGVMLPRDLEGALMKDLELDDDTTHRVSQEINRFILYPVKQQIEQLHKKVGEVEKEKPEVGIATPRHSDRVGVPDEADDYMTAEPAQSPEGIQAGPPQSEGLGGEDPYREKPE